MDHIWRRIHLHSPEIDTCLGGSPCFSGRCIELFDQRDFKFFGFRCGLPMIVDFIANWKMIDCIWVTLSQREDWYGALPIAHYTFERPSDWVPHDPAAHNLPEDWDPLPLCPPGDAFKLTD